MTQDDKKRLIRRELSALRRLDSNEDGPEKLQKLERLADLYYSVGQFQDACAKFHDYRTLGLRQGGLTPIEAVAIRIKEAWCQYERGDYDSVEATLATVINECSSLAEGPAETLKAEAGILHGYLDIRRGRYEEALLRCDKAFAILQRSDDHAAIAKVQICYGHGYFRTGELSRAREYYEDALASARRAGDSTRLVQATINLALVCKEQSDSTRALYLLEQANEVLKETGTFSYRAHVLINMAVIHTHRGDLNLAEEAYRDALRLYLQTGQKQGGVLARIGLSRIQVLRGRPVDAETMMESTLEACREGGYLREEVLVRRDLGDLLRTAGDWEGAITTYRRALEVALPLGEDSEHAIQIGRRIGLAHLRLGDRESASEEFSRALITARKVGERYEEAVLQCSLGMVAGIEGNWTRFDSMFGQGIDMLRRMGERIELGKALVRHVRIGMLHEGLETTDLQLEVAEARRIFLEAGVPLWLGKARIEEARLLNETGEQTKVEHSLAEAERIFTELHDTRHMDQVDLIRRALEDQMVDRSVSRRNDHLAIHELLPSTSMKFDLKSLLEELVARTNGDRGILMVFEGEEGKPIERSIHGLRQREAKGVIEVLHPILEVGFKEGRPFLSTAVASDPRIPGRVLSGGGSVRSLLVVPFHTNADISGAIYLDREDHRAPFASRELDLVVGLVRSQKFVLTLLASRQKELMEENTRLKKQVSHAGRFDEIVTQSEKMYDVLDLVRKVAGTNVTVLIQGETGTGKQLVTRAVHGESPRRDRTLFSINCATLPEQLLESELFGHKAGSFTGAHADKVGLLKEASGSTVFLDEIDKMNPSVQSKLLHVLEEKRIRPLGSNHYIDVDVRFVCASNRDLLNEVHEGNFLEDLYYRLNVIKIDIPPLRERLEDILLLSQYFLRIFSAEMGKEPIRLDEHASQMLLRHNWPGNVRELRSEMRRLVVLCDNNLVGPLDLSSVTQGEDRFGGDATLTPREPGAGSLRDQVAKHEKELLVGYLDRCDGNITRMAKLLGISRWGLHKKLDKHGLR